MLFSKNFSTRKKSSAPVRYQYNTLKKIMAYREDNDLKFLGEMTSADLDDLVNSIIKDKDNSLRFTEELTNSKIYKDNHPNHSKYWKEIAAEIQCFGGNTIATLIRGGKGVLYREILLDACEKSKVNYNKNQATINIENQLLLKILGDAIDKMDESQRAEFAKTVGITNLKTFSPESLMAAFQIIFKAGGFQSYQLTLVIANGVSRALLGRGLTLAGNAALTRAFAIISGPIGWAITGLLTVIDLAGPAFRVTLPATIHIALLRKQHQAELDGLWKDIQKEMS